MSMADNLAMASTSSMGDKMQLRPMPTTKIPLRWPDELFRLLQCSFGHQVKQSRGPAYVAHLEKKVKALQDELRRSPNRAEHMDTSQEEPVVQISPGSSISHPSPMNTSARPSLSSKSSDPSYFHTENVRSGSVKPTDGWVPPNETPVYLETLTTEPRGKAFGTDVLRQLFNYCNQIATSPYGSQDSSMKLVQALDNPQAIDDGPVTSSPLMPEKEITLKLVEVAFSEVFHLWPFVDRAQVDRTLFQLYNTSLFGQEASDEDELALVYAVLALGQRFDSTTPAAAEFRRVQGLQYFEAAKDLVPLSACDRGLASVQTVLCLALYLKAAPAPAKVHSYVAAASSAAHRLGLHEDVAGFPKDESALRCRVWSALQAFDIYTSTALGVPSVTNVEACEQNSYPPLSTGSNSELVASDAHMQMLRILARAVGKTYRSKSARKPVGIGTFAVDQNAIKEASEELENWAQGCSVLLQAATDMTRTQLCLAYAYDYAQLLLYAPFVHYLTMPGIDPCSQPYLIGMKAVNAALHAVQVAELLHHKLQFHEAYFLTIDVLVYAAVVLLVVESGGTEVPLVLEAMRAGRAAMELLLMLSLQTDTASQCWKALAVRSSRIAGNPGKSIGGSLTSTRPPFRDTGLRRAKAPGPIALPMSRPSTLHKADSGIDCTADSRRQSLVGSFSGAFDPGQGSFDSNFSAEDSGLQLRP
ncbi:hypothetical protein CKM354_000945600 [Cercospora kikuchii]|uniref:Xylanolytic transcriptional activator regulatory domain-containing protein n=1 Tax=Cercospora kikuchii TaxID=84275 RepID=A0A9P3CP38_9PEZI|nr:uncharacterized protein CKM354_000945600 [Cercospora kikuchii]GIZ46328.1 hypothetical protein CKM354_000945600 [Cercospora kikuchii]